MTPGICPNIRLHPQCAGDMWKRHLHFSVHGRSFSKLMTSRWYCGFPTSYPGSSLNGVGDLPARGSREHKFKMTSDWFPFQISPGAVWTEKTWCVFRVKPPFSNFSGIVWTGIQAEGTELRYNVMSKTSKSNFWLQCFIPASWTTDSNSLRGSSKQRER